MRATLLLVFATGLSGCVSSAAGPATARGTRPAEAVAVDAEVESLTIVEAGAAPFIDVMTRARLDRRLRTTVHYCIDATGVVVYSEIEKSSGNRTFDEHVRNYFAQSRYQPHVVGDAARPACSSSSLSYAEPSHGSVGRPKGSLSANRANTYVPECLAFEVAGDKVLCSNETIDKRRPVED